MPSLKIHVSGKVYHTGYRYFIKQKASQLKITGCVFYCPDRSVEILAFGVENFMDLFLTYCRIGNKDSFIEEVHLSLIPPVTFDSFEVFDEETSINTIGHKVDKIINI
jgi:acylphosphatase